MRLIIFTMFILSTLLYSSDNDSISEIELIDFNASLNDSIVVIKWMTASEYNNKHFIIERATNDPNSDFKSLDTVKGIGFSKEVNHYNIMDSTIEYGNSYYYRLTAEAFDGTINTYLNSLVKVEITEVKTSVLNTNNDYILDFELLENRIIIKPSTPLQSQLIIFNLEGKIINPKVDKLNDKDYAIDISNLPNGKYILLNNQNLICKFIK